MLRLLPYMVISTAMLPQQLCSFCDGLLVHTKHVRARRALKPRLWTGCEGPTAHAESDTTAHALGRRTWAPGRVRADPQGGSCLRGALTRQRPPRAALAGAAP